jgi:hypothetical protein
VDRAVTLALSGADVGQGRLDVGQGRLMVAGFAALLTAFVLEIRHIRVLGMLDGRHWIGRVRDDEAAPGDATPPPPADP